MSGVFFTESSSVGGPAQSNATSATRINTTVADEDYPLPTPPGPLCPKPFPAAAACGDEPSSPKPVTAASSHNDEFPSRQQCAVALAVLSALLRDSNAMPDAVDDACVTPFHSSAVPPVSVERYVRHVLAASGYDWHGLALGLGLLRRWCIRTGRVPTPLTAHRLLLATIVVAYKTGVDCFVQNKYMAEIGGVPLPELNNLEVALLVDLGFAAMPTRSEVAAAVGRLGAPPRPAVDALARAFQAE